MIFESIYSLSTENHGIVFSADAKRLGARDKDLSRWVKIGRLIKIGHGVYRTTHYPFSNDDSYAIAVACAGKNAYLCGESVLGLLNLAPTNPGVFHVAVPRKIHRELPDSCKVEVHPRGYEPVVRDGIPMQRPEDAIRSCIGLLMPERLLQAADEAHRQGLITRQAKDSLEKEIRQHE